MPSYDCYVVNPDGSVLFTETQPGYVTSVDTNGNAYFSPTNPGNVTTSYADNAAIDAFGRLRTAGPFTLFDSALQYSAMPLYWDSITAGSGSATHLPNEAAVRMRLTTASGDKVVRQTRRYYRYQPGKSQRVTMTTVLGAAKANVRQRIGYFDDRNGLFFEQTSAGLAVVKRSYVTGSAVDTKIAQADWNIDTMDGNGTSGITIDTSKGLIFLIDLEWLGVGRVRYGVIVDGLIYYVHELLHANNVTSVYMTTANLPARYEIENTAESASQTDMYHICTEIDSEGGVQERAQIFSVSNGASLVTVSNTLIPVLSLRLDTVFPANGTLLNRTTVLPQAIDIFASDYPIYYEILYNPTLTNPSWTDYNTTHSGTQYDVTASAVSGGIKIGSGYVAAGRNVAAAASFELVSDLALTLNAAGTTSDILTIAAIRTAANDADIGTSITWKELY